jgi:hypothetical protein
MYLNFLGLWYCTTSRRAWRENHQMSGTDTRLALPLPHVQAGVMGLYGLIVALTLKTSGPGGATPCWVGG